MWSYLIAKVAGKCNLCTQDEKESSLVSVWYIFSERPMHEDIAHGTHYNSPFPNCRFLLVFHVTQEHMWFLEVNRLSQGNSTAAGFLWVCMTPKSALVSRTCWTVQRSELPGLAGA